MSYKNIFWNSILLIIVEVILVALLFALYKTWLIESNGLDLIGKLKETIIGIMGISFYGFISKIVLELIPKILIQYFLIKKHYKQLRILKLWLYLLFYGIIVSLFWWSLVHYEFKLNLYSAVAIFNLFAIAVSPFVLKKLGWDIIEKITQEA